MDLVYIGLILTFVAISSAMAMGCDKLRRRSRDRGSRGS
jgi:hypothetical protein